MNLKIKQLMSHGVYTMKMLGIEKALRVSKEVLVTAKDRTAWAARVVYEGRMRMRNFNNRHQENARNLKKMAKLPWGQYPEYTALRERNYDSGKWQRPPTLLDEYENLTEVLSDA